MEETPKDKPLFGPVDQLVNTLELELSWVKGEIKNREGAISRAKKDLEHLNKRQSMLNESMTIVRDAERKRQQEEGGPLFPPKGKKAKNSDPPLDLRAVGDGDLARGGSPAKEEKPKAEKKAGKS